MDIYRANTNRTRPDRYVSENLYGTCSLIGLLFGHSWRTSCTSFHNEEKGECINDSIHGDLFVMLPLHCSTFVLVAFQRRQILMIGIYAATISP